MSLGSLGESVRLAWRDPADPPRHMRASTTSGIATVAAEGFITHEVSKLDTLAGIALKYNVPPSDIKRFNGLLSDTAMYARDTLLIPTNLLPVGEEIQILFAQVANRIGRDPILNADPNIHPPPRKSAAFNPTTFNVHAKGPLEELPWWCGCGTCRVDDEACSCRRPTRRSSDVRQVEMVQMVMQRPPSASRLRPLHLHEQVRRRHAAAQNRSDGDGWRDDGPWAPHIAPFHTQDSIGHAFDGGNSSTRATSTTSTLLTSIGKAIGDSGSVLVQRITQTTSPSRSSSRPRSSPASSDEAQQQSLLPNLGHSSSSHHLNDAARQWSTAPLKGGKGD